MLGVKDLYLNSIRAKKMEATYQDIFDHRIPIYKLLLVSLVCMIFGFVISWIFYKHIYISILCAITSLNLLNLYSKSYSNKINERIENEFYDVNILLSAELETGLPVNTAINSIKKEILSSDIYEFKYMNREILQWSKKMNMGINIDAIIADFALRSKNKSIIEYSNMISLCTKKGGSLREVIKNTNSILNEKKEFKRDLEVLTTEKRLEQKIMSLMPVVVLIMLDKTAPEFIEPLYNSIIGRITMTILLIIFLISYLWSSKISKLE